MYYMDTDDNFCSFCYIIITLLQFLLSATYQSRFRVQLRIYEMNCTIDARSGVSICQVQI